MLRRRQKKRIVICDKRGIVVRRILVLFNLVCNVASKKSGIEAVARHSGVKLTASYQA